MNIDPPLQQGRLLKRYKRFLADVQLPDGSEITVHCPNTGSMKNCIYPEHRVWFSDSGNPKRKYPCTWYFIENPEQQIIGIHTGISNTLAHEAIAAGVIPELEGYRVVRSEVPYGEQNSRIDLLLSDHSKANIPDCFVEVKNVSLEAEAGRGLFPDSVTTRGQKHLQELLAMRKQGFRAVLLFCVQHSGIEHVAPADEIDPEYAQLLRQAAAEGVELLAYRAKFDLARSKVELTKRLELHL